MKILIVDDEKDVEALFRQKFRKEIRNKDLEMDFAFSGKEALEILERKDPPDVVYVFSDINMPGMSGLQLLEKIKNTYLKPPPVVMMITAYGDQENYNNAKRLGADDFLTKPLDFKLLKEKLTEL